jgi:hypothetical protein
MKALCPKTVAAALVLLARLSLATPAVAVDAARFGAQDLSLADQVVEDTLVAYQILCLSVNGLIERVLLDGQWVAVKQVELINHTLILRTEQGNISLAAVVSAP